MKFTLLPKYQILPHIFISCEISLWEQDCQLRISSWHYKYKYSHWSYHLQWPVIMCVLPFQPVVPHLYSFLNYILDFFLCSSLSLILSNQCSPRFMASGVWVYVEYPSLLLCCFILFFLSLFIYFERGWEWMGERGGAEKERERESQAGFVLSAQSLLQGSIPWTLRSWPEPKSRIGHLTDWATQAPLLFHSWYVTMYLTFYR